MLKKFYSLPSDANYSTIRQLVIEVRNLERNPEMTVYYCIKTIVACCGLSLLFSIEYKYFKNIISIISNETEIRAFLN